MFVLVLPLKRNCCSLYDTHQLSFPKNYSSIIVPFECYETTQICELVLHCYWSTHNSNNNISSPYLYLYDKLLLSYSTLIASVSTVVLSQWPFVFFLPRLLIKKLFEQHPHESLSKERSIQQWTKEVYGRHRAPIILLTATRSKQQERKKCEMGLLFSECERGGINSTTTPH